MSTMHLIHYQQFRLGNNRFKWTVGFNSGHAPNIQQEFQVKKDGSYFFGYNVVYNLLKKKLSAYNQDKF